MFKKLLVIFSLIFLLYACGDDNVIEPKNGKKSVATIPNKADLDLEPWHKVLPFNTTNDLLEVVDMGNYTQEDIAPIIIGNIIIDDTRLVLNGLQSYDPIGRELFYRFSINGEDVCTCKYGVFELDPKEGLEVFFEAHVKKDGSDEAEQYLIGAAYHKKLDYARAMSKESSIGK